MHYSIIKKNQEPRMSYIGKALMIGDPTVGKTSILAQYVDGIFREEYYQTIGANFLIKEIELVKIIDKINVSEEVRNNIIEKGLKLYFWDIGGQSDKLFVTEYYFVQAVGAMVVFNVNDEKSLNNIDFWISKLKELSGEIPFVIVGNKSDLNKSIDQQKIEEKVSHYGVEYYETSAKLNVNIDKAFQALSVQILNHF